MKMKVKSNRKNQHHRGAEQNFPDQGRTPDPAETPRTTNCAKESAEACRVVAMEIVLRTAVIDWVTPAASLNFTTITVIAHAAVPLPVSIAKRFLFWRLLQSPSRD
jgi:hypothetical protein